MKYPWICYDAVENDVTYHVTEEEALESLKETIELSFEDGEWFDSVEDCFVAEIKHAIRPKRIPTTEEYRLETGISFDTDMVIVKA
jgi:hypothetical protein